MSIELTELARRLCLAAHPLFHTTGSPIPCGQHVQEAQRLWGLTQPVGAASLKVILEVRAEQGLPTP